VLPDCPIFRQAGKEEQLPGFHAGPREPGGGSVILRRRSGLLFGGLAVVSLAALVAALASGSAEVGIGAAWNALIGEAPDNIDNLVWQLRMPRALTAFGVGGLLAVAGVLMQVLLRNPLAEPYILGSSGGAAVAALAAMMMG